MASSRIEYIDRLKGFAILCVIMGHYVFLVLHQTGIIFEIISSFHMPLFMFMSGFVLTYVPSFRKCCHKVITFILPMLTVGLIYVWFTDSTIQAWLLSPFKFGYWYLYVLSVFYIFLFLIGRAGERIWKQGLAAVGVFVLFCIMNDFVSLKWNNVFSLWMMKLYWPYFISAYFVRRLDFESLIIHNNYIYSLALIGYILGFVLYFNGHSYLYRLNAFLSITVIVYLFIMTESNNNAVTSALSYLGRHTLDIYLIHFFIIHLTALSMVGNWFVETGNVFLEIITGVIYSVIVAYICIMAGKLLHLSNFINNIVFGSFVNKR